MAITKTNIHPGRVVEQIHRNLIGLQRDMVSNAESWKAMAVAQSPALNILQGYMHDGANAYLTRLKWYDDLRLDSVKRQRINDELTKRGWSETDFTTPSAEMYSVANQLKSAPLATYQACINACDGIIASVDPPDSLWPE